MVHYPEGGVGAGICAGQIAQAARDARLG